MTRRRSSVEANVRDDFRMHARSTDRRIGTERRRMGRPPLTPGEHSVSLSVALPTAIFDAIVALATDARLPTAAYVRVWLRHIATLKSASATKGGSLP
jgi:hypothetical protein